MHVYNEDLNALDFFKTMIPDIFFERMEQTQLFFLWTDIEKETHFPLTVVIIDI